MSELQRNFDVHHLDLAPIIPRLGQSQTLGWRPHLQQRIIEEFRAADRVRPVDVALLYVSNYECEPETLRSIEAAGVPVLVLSMDDKHTFDEVPSGIPNGQRPLIGAATLHLTTSLECIRWYAAEGVAAYFFPEAADPEVYLPLDLPKDIDVSFLGGWYGGRRRLVRRLRSLGINVQTFGPDTDHGTISRADIVRLFNRSRINLGFGGISASSRVTHLKGRDFEVPMSGNVYLTQYNHELALVYDIGREILCYLNEEDCAEQIRMLLDEPARANAIGSAARRRALQDHTWTRRTGDLMKWLGILASHTRDQTP